MGDHDGDGFADVLIYSQSEGLIEVLWGAPEPVVEAVAEDPQWGSREGRMIGVGDVNGDGADDLVFEPWREGRAAVRLGGERSAAFSDFLPWFSDPAPPLEILPLGDVDGDGAADVLALPEDGRPPSVHYGSLDGAFELGARRTEFIVGPDEALAFVQVAADVNQDGFADVVLNVERGPDREREVLIFHGAEEGLGDQRALTESDASIVGPSVYFATAAGRFSDDSEHALLVVGHASDGTRVTLVPAPSEPEIRLDEFSFLLQPHVDGGLFSVGDLDGDGLDDLHTRDTRGPNGVFYYGGSLTDGPSGQIRYTINGSFVAAGDVNGDGLDDVLAREHMIVDDCGPGRASYLVLGAPR